MCGIKSFKFEKVTRCISSVLTIRILKAGKEMEARRVFYVVWVSQRKRLLQDEILQPMWQQESSASSDGLDPDQVTRHIY